MQTLTIGAYRATLKPTRNVGEFTAKLAKCNGKSRRLPLRDLRTKARFPVFKPGMSTAEYVRLYSSGDGSQLKAWEWARLNEEPCTFYSGEDACETLPDGFESWEDFDAAQSSSAAPESAPAAANDDAASSAPDPEPAAPVDAPAPTAAGLIADAIARGRSRTPIAHLPIYARLAIDRADADSALRTSDKVREMVYSYARTYGAAPESWEIESALYICGRRFFDFDAAQGSSAAAESAPADAELIDAAEPVAPDDAIAPAIVAGAEPYAPAPSARAEPYPGCEPAAAIVYRVHLATAAHSRAIDPAFKGYRRPRSACMLADFAAPDVRAHRAAIARSVRAERAGRAAPTAPTPDPLPTHSQTSPSADPLATHSQSAAPVCAPADDEPAETGAAWFERIIAENKAKRDDCEARAQKVAPLDSVPFKHSDGERFGIAGPCMSEPGRFRFSYFDSRGAIGHCTRDTLALAMWEALDLGYLYATEDTAPASPHATNSEPAPVRPVYANDYLAWLDVENGRAEPDEYQARLIECFGEVKAGGLFYNSDTYPAAAALMTARYGYPDWRGDRGQSDGVQDPFGMDCYRANCVIRARAERERERGAAATFKVGQRFARLIFSDGKQRTAAELVTLDPAGFACKLKAKSGRNSVEVTCSAYALSMAVIRAEERGKVLAAKRSRARPEPIAPMPAEPAPVPGKSEPETVMLQHVLGALQRIAPDGLPDSAMLVREADRIEAAAERMRDAMPDYSATCAAVARDLRSLADSAIDPLPGDTKPEALDDDETIPAPLDGLDVAELGDDGMAEFEQATREQATAPAYRELTTAHYRPQGPCLRIPAYDARAMIPQRFAPVYLLQS